MPVINLLSILFFIFTLMYVLCIYIFNYTQCIIYFIYAIITHYFQTWQDESSVFDARGGVQQGPPGSLH
jgi:hypothetical protein